MVVIAAYKVYTEQKKNGYKLRLSDLHTWFGKLKIVMEIKDLGPGYYL